MKQAALQKNLVSVSLARFARVNFLVSGNLHLMELLHPQPPVLTPHAFLERL